MIKSLSQSSLDLEDTLKRVMDEAKELMNADRSTLWLIDRDRDQIALSKQSRLRRHPEASDG